MTTAVVRYTGDLRTECIHTRSGAKIITDAPTDNHGKGEAFSPTDMVSTALATCILTTIGIVAARDNMTPITGSEAMVTKVMYSDPRRIGEIIISIKFAGGNFTDKEKIIYERTAHTCPVAKSLSPDLKQEITFIWP
jgi:putative redox protein